MQHLVYIPMIVLWASTSVGKASFQGGFLRKNSKNATDTLFFNCLIFWMSAVTMSVLFFRELPSWGTVLYAAVFGSSSILYQYVYSQAMECGPISLTVMLNSFNILFAIAAGLIWFGDPLKWTGIVGLVLLFAALALLVGKEKKPADGASGGKSISLKWFLLVLVALTVSGLLTVEMRVYKMQPFGDESGAFVAVAYIIAGVLSLPIVWLRHKKLPATLRVNGRSLLGALIPGILLGLYQVIQLYLVPRVPAGMLYPICNGSLSMISTLVGVFFFHDKLSRRQFLGLFLGIVSIVLVSI